jgi:hypothetical protein
VAVEAEDGPHEERAQAHTDFEQAERAERTAPPLATGAECVAAKSDAEEEAGQGGRGGEGGRAEDGGELADPEDLVDEAQGTGDEEEEMEKQERRSVARAGTLRLVRRLPSRTDG